MARAWIPQNQEEANKRAAGRRKLHMRRREARAERILRILQAMQMDENLRAGTHGWTTEVAEAMKVSVATASRDLKLGRAILNTFAAVFEREYDPDVDEVVWSWDWASFGFRTRETGKVSRKEASGYFVFSTRNN